MGSFNISLLNTLTSLLAVYIGTAPLFLIIYYRSIGGLYSKCVFIFVAVDKFWDVFLILSCATCYNHSYRSGEPCYVVYYALTGF